MDIGTHWRTIIESVHDGVMIVNASGDIVAANHMAQLMTGYGENELIGRSCRTLNCTGCTIIGKGEGRMWCGLFSNGMIRDRKCRITSKQGRSVHIVKSATVLYDDNDNIIGAVETLKDVTDTINYKNELMALKKTYQLDDGFHGIVGKSPVMQGLFEVIETVAPTDTPVMILGESGTGKELVAKALHETGARCDKPFIKVNCAALNENLLESELFGHVRGAFTGAERGRVGRFEAAHGGTIFLDEIGDIPMPTQVKLLRVLEDRKVERVGDHRAIDVDVRIITATNRNLETLMRDGTFREDLFFRINVFPLRCPSLSDRKEDIPLIIQHFVEVNSRKTGKNVLGVSPEAMKLMMTYPWPGNVRELRNTVEYAFVLCHTNMITPEHLPDKVLQGGAASAAKSSEIVHFCEGVLGSRDQQEELEEALALERGNQSRAAARLGISRVTVWKRMKKYGIDPKGFV